ncbi:hypothetical protein MSAN_00905200 [Mycena sanguinolenta]|uniref:Uncharacterized protein n=1 Tax=Mycena sanguinolenta TaxID=230812 RepID=A0A8H6YSQ7_9AGAR|nr:hypothetical protein MSAN_00905200 [Mycena sanguinolenta]
MISTFLPMLTELRFCIVNYLDNEAEQDENTTDMATPCFSQLALAAIQVRLQQLAIAWEFEYMDDLDEYFFSEVEAPELNFESHELNELRDVLVKYCPDLTTLRLDGGGLLFVLLAQIIFVTD